MSKRGSTATRLLSMSLLMVPSRGFMVRTVCRQRSVSHRIDQHGERWSRRLRKSFLWSPLCSFAQCSTSGEFEENEEMEGAGVLDDFLSGNMEQLLSELSSSSPENDVTPDNGWMTMDWETYANATTTTTSVPMDSYRVSRRETLSRLANGQPSPVEGVLVRNRVVYVKRDDLLRLEGSNVSGNKARKMYALNQVPADDFPDCVVSYGGPQSNAMLALAAIVHSKNIQLSLEQDDDNSLVNNKKRFLYYTKKLPRFLRNHPSGNFFRAQTLGMEIIELSNGEYNDLFSTESGGRPEAPPGLAPPVPFKSLWIPQGGACEVAVLGGRIQAQEIVSFWSQQGRGRPLSVCVPGGTCTTALLLHREINSLLSKFQEKMDIRVVVIPCVGDDAYARRQMMALNTQTGEEGKESDIPVVLTPNDDGTYGGPARGYFRFGEPDEAILQTFREMKEEHGIDVDLLYGAPSWTLLLQHWRDESDDSGEFDERHPLAGREVMYVHSGGLEGVTSQLMRYKYKGLVESDEIQLPGRRQKSTSTKASNR